VKKANRSGIPLLSGVDIYGDYNCCPVPPLLFLVSMIKNVCYEMGLILLVLETPKK
jgi:hypothetical protein